MTQRIKIVKNKNLKMYGLSLELGTRSIESQEEAVLAREMELMSTHQTSLSSIDQPTEPIFQTMWCPYRTSTCVAIKAGCNANIRLFYFALLSLCFQKDSQGAFQASGSSLLTNLKSTAYSPSLNLCQFPAAELPIEFIPFLPVYSDLTLKRLLVEFFQVLRYSTDIAGMLNRYPVIDFAMVLMVRTLLGSTTLRYAITMEVLRKYFGSVFGMQVDAKTFELQGAPMKLEHGEDYSYVVRGNVLGSRSSSTQQRHSQAAQPIAPQNPAVTQRSDPHSISSYESIEVCRHESQRTQDSLEPVMSLRKKRQTSRTLGQPPKSPQSNHETGDILFIPSHSNLTDNSEGEKQVEQVKKSIWSRERNVSLRDQCERLGEFVGPDGSGVEGHVDLFRNQFSPKKNTSVANRPTIKRNFTFSESTFVKSALVIHRNSDEVYSPLTLASMDKFNKPQSKLRETVTKSSWTPLVFEKWGTTRETLNTTLEGLLTPKRTSGKKCNFMKVHDNKYE